MAKTTTGKATKKSATKAASKKAVLDTRFEVKRTQRPFDGAVCFEIYFLDKPAKHVKEALKAFKVEGGSQMFHWCDWTGAWYATETACGGNIENVKAALTQALDSTPAKPMSRTESLEAQVNKLTLMMAKLLEAQDK